jgi:hypothetical protein
MGIGPDALLLHPTFGNTYPQYKSLGHEIIIDIANIIGGEDVEMLGEEASRLLDRFEPLFSKVLEFIGGALETCGPYDGVAYWVE